MPTYLYQCPKCCEEFEQVLKLSDFDTPQQCPKCGSSPAKRLIAGSVGFVLKGDGWAGKNLRVKGQMARRRKALESREKELYRDGPSVRLAPNVDGERTDSWADAMRLAKSKGKDTSSYEPIVHKEKTEAL